MSATPGPETNVAWMTEPAKRRRWGFGFGRKGVAAPRPGETDLYSYDLDDHGAPRLRRLRADSQPATDGEKRIQVATGRRPLSIALTRLLTDGQGHVWDLTLEGTCSITHSLRFLSAKALALVRPDSPLPWQVAESWLIQTALPPARKAVAAASAAEVLAGHDLKADAWQDNLNEWLEELGLTVRIAHIRWTSADAEQAQAERQRLAQAERLQQERQRQQDAELRQVAAEAEYQQQKQRIAANARLSAEQQALELHQLELRRQRETLEAQRQAEEIRLAAERAKLEHELSLARLKRDLEAVGQAEQQRKVEEQQHQETLARLAAAEQALARLSRVAEPVLGQLHGRDSGQAHQAAERLASPEFGGKGDTLTLFNLATPPQLLTQFLRDKSVADGQPIALKMVQLRTRDIGVAKIPTLPTGASLQFELTTKRPGYLTLLNIGTSGSVYAHVPSAYAALPRTQVNSGSKYVIPGPSLLPLESLQHWGLEYIEGGPPGWEHLAAIVSDQPLISSALLGRASGDNPFPKFTADELEALGEQLSSLDDRAWSAGVLSFLVE